MAGRGRGKPTMSFNTEQLGVAKGELPAQVLQPPSAYPMPDLHISNFESTNELDYLVELKREFAEYMRDSVNNVLPDIQKKDIERYSDHYQDTITENTEQESKYDWSRMPADLTSPRKRKKATNSSNKKDNINKTTATRRKRRRILDDDDDDDNANAQSTEVKNKQTQNNTGKVIKEEEEDEENSEEEMEEYEEVDEEMDDGTDYVNNYFDNGEGFDDEDDNLDDGPIY